MTNIGVVAFGGCISLASLDLPDNSSIDIFAFPENTNLYVSRGSKTLLNLWARDYTNVYDKSAKANNIIRYSDGSTRKVVVK